MSLLFLITFFILLFYLDSFFPPSKLFFLNMDLHLLQASNRASLNNLHNPARCSFNRFSSFYVVPPTKGKSYCTGVLVCIFLSLRMLNRKVVCLLISIASSTVTSFARFDELLATKSPADFVPWASLTTWSKKEALTSLKMSPLHQIL